VTINGSSTVNFWTGGLRPEGYGTHSSGTDSAPWLAVWARQFRGAEEGSAGVPVYGMFGSSSGIYFEGGTLLPAISHFGSSKGRVMGMKMSEAWQRHGGNIPNPAGATTRNVSRATVAGNVKKIYALVEGGVNAVVNASRAGSNLRSADLTVTAGAGWVDFGTLQNTLTSIGDAFKIEIVSISGSPTEVAIQIEFEVQT
jgi:hypothetical protein